MMGPLRRQSGKQDLKSSSANAETPSSVQHNTGTNNAQSTSRKRSLGDIESPITRHSSSSSLWGRYKNRSATRTSDTTIQSRENILLSVSPSAFGECFDPNFPCLTPEISKPRLLALQASRKDEEDPYMLASLTTGQKPSAAMGFISPAEDERAEAGRPHEDDVFRKRSTRSQDRRQERAPSMQDNTPPVVAKGSITRPHSPTDDIAPELPPLGIRHPSAQESIRKVISNPQSSSPTSSSTARPSPTRTPSSPTLPLASPSAKLSGKAKLQSLIPTSPSQSRTKKISPPPQVVVRPPIPDPTKPAFRQWESDLKTSSLALMPWGDSKRWMCCNCGAQTIVEQAVCARLVCGHIRCEDARCRGVLIRDRVATTDG